MHGSLLDIVLLFGIMHINEQTFRVDKEETVKLDGTYEIVTVDNRMPWADLQENIVLHAKAVYHRGNVLKKTDVDIVDELIDLMIRYTHDKCADVDLDFTCRKTEQIRSGTVCPSIEDAFIYKNRQFTLYGRYIYGYENPFVTFQTFKENEPNEKITLPAVPFEERMATDHLNEYVYAFKITNLETDVLEAFALYS